MRGCCTFHTISCEPQTALKKKIYLLKRKVDIKKKNESKLMGGFDKLL